MSFMVSDFLCGSEDRDLASPLLWLWLRQWSGFDSWPRNLHMPQALPKKKFLWFHVLVFNPFWVYFCVLCEDMFELYCFTCGCPTFSALLSEEIVFFFIIYSSLLCCGLIYCRCIGLFLGSLFCSVDPYVCFCVNIMLLYSIVWSLGWLCPCCVLFPQDWGNSGSFMIPYTF